MQTRLYRGIPKLGFWPKFDSPPIPIVYVFTDYSSTYIKNIIYEARSQVGIYGYYINPVF